jgi:hypothetical protein
MNSTIDKYRYSDLILTVYVMLEVVNRVRPSACYTQGGQSITVFMLWSLQFVFGTPTANMTESDSDKSIFLTQNYLTNSAETEYDTDKVWIGIGHYERKKSF